MMMHRLLRLDLEKGNFWNNNWINVIFTLSFKKPAIYDSTQSAKNEEKCLKRIVEENEHENFYLVLNEVLDFVGNEIDLVATEIVGVGLGEFINGL